MHMLTHTDVKPYSCPDDACNKEFRRNCDLRRHLSSHDGGSPNSSETLSESECGNSVRSSFSVTRSSPASGPPHRAYCTSPIPPSASFVVDKTKLNSP